MLIRLIILATLLVCSPQPAFAGPIVSDAWYIFSWRYGNTMGCFPADPLSTNVCATPLGVIEADAPEWTIEGAGSFEVLDLSGLLDWFEVFDQGVLLGVTPMPAGGGHCGTSDATIIQECLANPGASYGRFLLADGQHNIQINQFGASRGAALFRFNSQVPAPSPTFLIFAAVLMLLCIRVRLRFSSKN
jgi:hypothetical protein